MAAFNFPTLAQCGSFIKTMWQGYRPTAGFERGTALWLMAKKLGKIVWREHLSIEQAIRAWHPGTTYGEYLDWYLKWFRGEPGRYQAAGSSGTDALSISYTGSPGAVLNAILTDERGLQYKVTEELVGGGSPESLSVEAVDVGTATNLETGDVLTFVSPPANVDAEATLVADLDGGRNRETDDEGRLWLLERFQNPIISGHPTQIRDVCEQALPGLIRCYVYPKRNGYPYGFGTVDVACLQLAESEADRIITAAQKATIEAAAEAELPTDLWLDFRVLTVTEEDSGGTRIEMTIKTAVGAPADKLVDWDVDAIATAPDVLAYTWGDKEIQADQDITGYGDGRDMVAGDRIYVEGQDAELIVATVGVGANSKFTVTTWPWGDGLGPSVNQKIFSGGGLVGDIKTAEAELADALGTEKGSAYYTGDSGWRDTLYVLRAQKAALDVDDYMLDVVIDDIGGGAVDYAPTALTGDTVNLITVPIGSVVVYQDLT